MAGAIGIQKKIGIVMANFSKIVLKLQFEKKPHTM